MSLLKGYFSYPIFKPNRYKIITFVVIQILLYLLFIYVRDYLHFGYASAILISPLLVLYYSLGGFVLNIILSLPRSYGYFAPFYENWLNFFVYSTGLIIGIGLMFFWYSVVCYLAKLLSYLKNRILSS